MRARRSTTLGTDTDPPYTATFDSTLVPNTDGPNGTLYARAHDAAGNQTQAGNGITVSNATVTDASISISGRPNALAGAASAPIADIPVDAIRGAEDDGPDAAPLAGVPLAGVPLAGVPLAGVPLAGVPLGGFGFTLANLNQNGLGGIPLSSIALKSSVDTWQKRLDASPAFFGAPAQSVTLAQVLGTSVVTTPTEVTLDDVDLESSPLAGVPLAGVALGGLPLAGVPLAGVGATPAENLAAWCAYINTQPGYSCTDPNSLVGQTMIGISLQGVPLAGVPLADIPLAGVDLSSSPLAGVPLAGVDLEGSPLAGVPLAGVDFASSPLAGVPLAGVSTAAKDEILTCTAGDAACTAVSTLGEADAAGLIDPSATVGDIGYYCTVGTPADSACLAGHTPILLKDFVLNGLPPDVTLEDLLGSILSEVAYDWEALPLPGFPIQDFSQDGGVNDYAVDFFISGSGGTTSASIAVALPSDARYYLGSSFLSGHDGALPDPTLDKGNVLRWQLTNVPLNQELTLNFEVRTGLLLRTERASAQLTAASRGEPVHAQTETPASTRILQTFGCTVECITPEIQADTLYLGYTANGNDRDRFRIAVPEAGTKVTVRLSHLAADDDLVVYGDVPAPLRQPKGTTSSLQAADVSPVLQQRSQAVIPEVLGDVPVNPPEGQGVLGVSDNRGLADEEVTFIVPEDSDGWINIQITSFDGAYSNRPWMLRVEESPPIELPPGCKTPVALGGGTTRALPTSVTGNTLYLFNSKRYGDLFGNANETLLWNKLQTMAARSDAAGGTVIPVDAIPGMATTLGVWQANPCSPGLNNDVVRALGTYLDGITAAYKYIVIVGDWTVLPAGLVLDNTFYANEREYASTFFGAENTQYLSSFALGYLPTDDPYGDTSYSGVGAYIPEVAVGRLVETHDEIMGQLDQYTRPTVNGAIDPATGLVTGYDFLSDGANAVSDALNATVAAPTELINEVWTTDNLLAAMFPATNAPQIDAVNAHYDHYRALPADQNAAGTEDDLFTTAKLQPTPGRLVITIGCHSGTPVSDFLVAAGLAPDWSQTYSAKGAIGYVAQSTFGLGETAGVAYSEKLQQLLAERLDGSLTVGQALVFAKQEYSSMPLTGGYDVKVMNGSGLYGLPMYRVGTGAATPPPLPLPLHPDAATGLNAATLQPVAVVHPGGRGDGGRLLHERRQRVVPEQAPDPAVHEARRDAAWLRGARCADHQRDLQ